MEITIVKDGKYLISDANGNQEIKHCKANETITLKRSKIVSVQELQSE